MSKKTERSRSRRLRRGIRPISHLKIVWCLIGQISSTSTCRRISFEQSSNDTTANQNIYDSFIIYLARNINLSQGCITREPNIWNLYGKMKININISKTTNSESDIHPRVPYLLSNKIHEQLEQCFSTCVPREIVKCAARLLDK